MARTITKDIEVSWGDLDALNHVNNTTYLRYMEDTRMVWLSGLEGGLELSDHGPVVVNININFRREIGFPSYLRVSLLVSQASEKRILHHYTITDRDHPETVYADADLTLVWVSRKTGRSIPIPDFVLASLDPHEGTSNA